MTDSIAFRIDGLPTEESMRARSREILEKVGGSHSLIRTLGWDRLRDSIGGMLKQGLAQEDGLSWLARAWTISRELEAAAVETLDGKVAERLVPLASHSLSQEVHPTVTLSCAGAELELEFTIDLSAEIECVDLLVRRGCLVAIQAGRLIPTAVLSFEGIELSRKSGDPIDLTMPHPLPGNGFQIADEGQIPGI